MINIEQLCGAVIDPKDERDHIFSGSVGAVYIPNKESLSLPIKEPPRKLEYTMSAVGNQADRGQGNLGTCVAWACGDAMKEWMEYQEEQRYIELCVNILYEWCKKLDGFPNREGTNIRTAMKVLQKKGIPHESVWPYSSWETTPKKEEEYIIKQAENYRIKSYARVDYTDPIELEKALFNMGPFPVALKIYNPEWINTSGLIELPDKNSTYAGLHAVCLVGYDRKNKRFLIKNSWGKSWGLGGYAYLPYEYVIQYAIAAWAAYDKKNLRRLEGGSRYWLLEQIRKIIRKLNL